jgi:hypothetical protein
MNDSIGIVSLYTEISLELIGNLGEEDKSLYTILISVTNLGHHGLKRVALASRHGFNGLVEVLVVDEEGVDEVCGSDDVFAEHVADCGRFTVSAWAFSLLVH